MSYGDYFTQVRHSLVFYCDEASKNVGVFYQNIIVTPLSKTYEESLSKRQKQFLSHAPTIISTIVVSTSPKREVFLGISLLTVLNITIAKPSDDLMKQIVMGVGIVVTGRTLRASAEAVFHCALAVILLFSSTYYKEIKEYAISNNKA